MLRPADLRLSDFYRLLIALFSVLFAVQLLTGIWLFVAKLGWTPSQLESYYLGNPEAFTQPKSFLGLLETTLPHLVAIGSTGFILAHFLMFVPGLPARKKWLWGLGLMLAAAADMAAGYLVIYASRHFVYLKLAGFLLFEVCVFASLGWILRSAFLFSRRRNPDPN